MEARLLMYIVVNGLQLPVLLYEEVAWLDSTIHRVGD